MSPRGKARLAPCVFISLWNLRSLQSHFIRNPILACSISESLGTYVEWKWLSISIRICLMFFSASFLLCLLFGVSLSTLDFYSCLCVYAFHFCILASVGAMPGFSFQRVLLRYIYEFLLTLPIWGYFHFHTAYFFLVGLSSLSCVLNSEFKSI